MRAIMVALIAAGALTGVRLHAEECVTTLKDTDNTKDLSRIIGCLYGKIKDLEAEVRTLKAVRSETGAAPGDAVSATSAVLQDNDFFTVTSGGVSKAGPRVSLTLNVRNKTEKEIYLAWEASTPILTDESGRSSSRYQSTMPNVNRAEARQQVFAMLGPGAVRPISVTFADDAIKGSTLTFGANMVQLDGDKHHYYSIGWKSVTVDK